MVGRRDFLKVSGWTMGGAFVGSRLPESSQEPSDPVRALRPMIGGILKITDAERMARREKARELMAANEIDAVVMEPGSTLFYFTGVRWWASERLFALVLPARGPMSWVCPRFEEDRARELI